MSSKCPTWFQCTQRFSPIIFKASTFNPPLPTPPGRPGTPGNFGTSIPPKVFPLFEKVKIPEAKENIRIIRIFMGDQQTAAVARSKIAKGKN